MESATNHGLNSDFLDILRELTDARADFVIVGAHALSIHAEPRSTGDLDVLVKPSPDNAQRVMSALVAFGAPIDQHGIDLDDLAKPGLVYQIGLPPRRIDILTSVTGVSFEQVRRTQVRKNIEGIAVAFMGREALIQNKQALGRPKDLADLAALENSHSKD